MGLNNYIKTFESFMGIDLIDKIKTISTTKVKCYNETVQNEIIKYVEHQKGEFYFIRKTEDPIKDLEIGFSASFFF